MPNRLIHEKSPYLLEHAHNPVDWLPWGDEALAKARAKDVPLFVSVGYSACHWCHVMARECFEDGQIAALLNAGFVSVKVDREERPDVDALLMRACQMMTGSGGWPLSVFLTPAGEPFYAGTYFPKAGFTELLDAIKAMWANERGALLANCGRLLAAMEAAQRVRPGEIGGQMLERCLRELASGFDPEYGGFGRAPKFPTPHVLMLLLRCYALNGNEHALAMAEKTLSGMAGGGMYDQIGGGFCRYSTDREWLVPHFEKMLYDNALLALVYTEAHQLTGAALYGRVAQQTLDYALREMRHAQGGFFCAQDADSGGREGGYYLFGYDEVIRVLGEADGQAACAALGITRQGNFEGCSVPNRLHGGADVPAPLPNKLREYRGSRMALRTDDKVLTAWNALMIASLAVAAGAFGRADYLEAALSALAFVDANLTTSDGLLARWREGEAKGPGTLDDYAFLAWALTNLYGATLEPAYMDRARALCEQAARKFGGEPGEGYYLSEPGLIVRPRESADNALPSGNSVMALALLKLARHFGDDALMRRADGQLRYIAGAAEAYPSGHAFGLIALLMRLHPETTISCVAGSDSDAAAFIDFLGRRFLPNAQAEIIRADGPARYQVCKNNACGLPVDSLDALAL